MITAGGIPRETLRPFAFLSHSGGLQEKWAGAIMCADDDLAAEGSAQGPAGHQFETLFSQCTSPSFTAGQQHFVTLTFRKDLGWQAADRKKNGR